MTSKISNTRKIAAQKFIRVHFGKISEREMARRLSIGKTSINRWARELGLEVLKHTVNENFFDDLNEKSSYLLGYIYADGNVNWNLKKCYWALTITTAAKDKEHLEKLRKLLSSTKPLLYSKGTNSYRLIVNSKSLCQKLMKKGVIPRKSLICTFPSLPKEQIRHFIRGVIDGDGNVRYVKRQRSSYFEITIASGSKKFCDGLIATICSAINIETVPRKVEPRTYIIQYSCSRGEKLAHWIYSGATIFLNRKYEPYNGNIRRK